MYRNHEEVGPQVLDTENDPTPPDLTFAFVVANTRVSTGAAKAHQGLHVVFGRGRRKLLQGNPIQRAASDGGLSTTLHADGSIVDAQELVVVLYGQELGQGLQVRGVLLNQVLVQVIPRNLNHGL